MVIVLISVRGFMFEVVVLKLFHANRIHIIVSEWKKEQIIKCLQTVKGYVCVKQPRLLKCIILFKIPKAGNKPRQQESLTHVTLFCTSI